MKVFLDDIRDAPHGWFLCLTVDEVIKVFDSGFPVEEISLDHDLGLDQPTGYDFLKWLEEKVHRKDFKGNLKIHVHSSNPPGRKIMKQAIKSMEKYTKGRIKGIE